jgi:hypothetical protein
MSAADLTLEELVRRLAGQGYRVIAGEAKGGLWVRNPDMSKPPFVDDNSFVSFATARKLCQKMP